MVTLATLYNDFKTLIKQNFYDKDEVDDALDTKQDTLVSGTSIKTINNNSILGSGNIAISGSGTVDSALSTTSTNPVQNKVINTALTNKVDKSDGANQMTDSSAYSNLGTSANSTQKTINNAIDTEISSINNSITNLVTVQRIALTRLNQTLANNSYVDLSTTITIPSGYNVLDYYVRYWAGVTQVSRLELNGTTLSVRGWNNTGSAQSNVYIYIGVLYIRDL